MAITTWQLLAQLDLLHQLQPPAFKDDGEWELPEIEAEESDRASI